MMLAPVKVELATMSKGRFKLPLLLKKAKEAPSLSVTDEFSLAVSSRYVRPDAPAKSRFPSKPATLSPRSILAATVCSGVLFGNRSVAVEVIVLVTMSAKPLRFSKP